MNAEFNIAEGIPQQEMESIEDYMVWRQHVGEMYSLLREKKLPVESLTFDWLPNDEAVIANFEEDNNKIMVVKPEASIETLWEYKTATEINRARVYGTTYIGAISADGMVYVFDYTRKERAPLELEAHTDNGFAICWSATGLLATGDDTRKIVVWEIDFQNWTASKLAEKIPEFTTARQDTKGINDLTWLGDQLVAGCDDGFIRVYDKTLADLGEYDSGQGKVDCLAPNPLSTHMVASGGGDFTIALWDLRRMQQPVHVMTGHDKTIASIKFSPVVDGVLASAGEDRRVVVWDIRNIGTTQDPEEAEEALPEISFIHGGHVMMVNDLSWHPTRPWVLASVAEDRTVQIWKPNELVTNEAKVPELPAALLQKPVNPFST